MNESLLAVLTALVGALIWLVKSMTTRSDKIIEQRDREMSETLKMSHDAVTLMRKSFNAATQAREDNLRFFERVEQRAIRTEEAHGEILAEIQKVHRKLPIANGSDGSRLDG